MKKLTFERQSMIQALIKYELTVLIDKRVALNDVSRFFAEGGFHNYTDKELEKACKQNLWIEFDDE